MMFPDIIGEVKLSLYKRAFSGRELPNLDLQKSIKVGLN